MKLKQIWYIISILGIIALILYSGYLIGRRDLIDSAPDAITLIGPNSSIQNSLTEIEIRPIQGSVDSQVVTANFGQFYFKSVSTDKIEILFRIQNVPDLVLQNKSKQSRSIPNELDIVTCKRSINGLDYEYTKIGKLIFDEPKNKIRSASFSTIIKSNLNGVERVWLLPNKPEDANVFIDTSPDLPINVRKNPAPYFWVIL